MTQTPDEEDWFVWGYCRGRVKWQTGYFTKEAAESIADDLRKEQGEFIIADSYEERHRRYQEFRAAALPITGFIRQSFHGPDA